MTLDTWLHFLHILSAIVWVGGGFVLSVVGSRVRSSSRPEAMAEFSDLLAYVGMRVMLAAVVGTLVSGIWMVLENAD